MLKRFTSFSDNISRNCVIRVSKGTTALSLAALNSASMAESFIKLTLDSTSFLVLLALSCTFLSNKNDDLLVSNN